MAGGAPPPDCSQHAPSAAPFAPSAYEAATAVEIATAAGAGTGAAAAYGQALPAPGVVAFA
eukprot:CAMPEP_0202400334 /NCGR_PEP_ID=MMETSP1128-20130828/2652_1 /ASSEMBLY_ACC=CAM_ASM_000463 /TAXON_ID=3047 /ORGANISM="Dunaliella tertiolecta, Strain CCMP1320" /LENGTH=60 /DNA_ID=CAMNT_0049003855 /DNA_START=1844 /DNA_END=2023 /DNA_ORIENTATION=-